MAETPDVHTHVAENLSARERFSYADTLHCNRCGFCTSYCPTYLATGDESLSPRGRNQVFRALLEGRLQDPSAASRSIDTCLQCGICTSVCFAEVPTGKLMAAAKQKVWGKTGTPWAARLAFRFLLPHPRLLSTVLWPLFLLKRLGAAFFFRPLLRAFWPALAAADDIMDRAPLRFGRSRVPPAAPGARVIQFMSCGSSYLRPAVAAATRGLVEKTGLPCGRAGTACCGLPASSAGDLDAARVLARANIEALEEFPDAVVLVDDSSCAATLKDYPSFFKEDPAWLPRAQAVAARTRDLSEWLEPFFSSLSSRLSSPPSKVTYHDPCKARYAQKLTEPPRRLLKGLPGVEFVELPEVDQCCGGGGAVGFQHPELSAQVGNRKAQNIIATGAEVVLSSSVSCLLQLKLSLRRAGSRVQGLHLAEFLEKMIK